MMRPFGIMASPISMMFFICYDMYVYVCLGTEAACKIAQTLQDVPYGQGEDEKLDVYMPQLTSAGGFHLWFCLWGCCQSLFCVSLMC